jgi:hypothetical protein
MSSHRTKVKSCLTVLKSGYRSLSKSLTTLTVLSLAMSASLAFAQSATTTSLSVTPITATNGSVLAMTASVKAGATPVSGGVVTFLDTYNNGISRVLGSVQVQSASGTAVLQQELGGVGSHSIKAVFGAIQAYSSSSDVQSVTITGTYPTTTSLVKTSAGTTPPFSLTATVVGTGSTSTFPVGNISLLDTSNANYLIVTPPPALGAGVSGQQTVAGSTSPITVGSGPQSIASGDFNRDGFIDLAVLNRNDNTVSILFGDGAGGFTASPTKLATGNIPVAIVAADFNKDGKLDLAVANSADGTLSIYLGGTNGVFSAPSTYSIPGVFLQITTPTSLVVGDFDGNGTPDIAVAQSSILLDLIPVNGVVDIMLGDGAGGFPTANVSQVTVGLNPTSIVAGYFNGGSNLDFAVTNKSSNNISVILGNGNGTTFTQATGSPISTGNGTAPNSLVAADINGDGKLDLAATFSSTKNIGLFQGNGAGGFTLLATSPSTGTTPASIVAGDFNADGNVDLAVANSGQTTASLYLGNGDFTFQTPTTPTVATTPIAVASADFNGDGTSDLAIANNGSNSVSILLNQVTDTASVSFTGVTIPGSGNHNILASFPTNLDFAASKSTTLSLAATKITTSILLSTTNSTPAFGQQIVITATFSPSLVGSLIPGGTVTFKDNGTALGTAVTVSGGIATLSTAALAVGAHSITASYSGDTNFLASSSTSALTITVGPAIPVITWATPAAISYGTLLSSAQLNATTTAPGTFSYNPAPYTLLAVGTYTLTAAFTPSNSNFTSATATVTLTVNPANPQISWPSPAPITFPTPLSNIQLNATVAVYTPVPLSSYYNINAIYSNGTVFTGGFDQSRNAYSANLLGTSVTWNNITYQLGPANTLDAVASLSSTRTTVTIALPPGYYASLNLLGAMVNNTTPANPFIITYTDGTTSTFTQSLSDWVFPQNFVGESNITCVPYRNTSTGGQDAHLTCVYGYQIPLNSSKIVQSVTLPAWLGPGDVSILAMDLVSPPVPGTLVYNPPSGTVLPTGENTLSATFTPTDQTDYTGASASVQLLVNPSNATTLVWPTPTPITYGTALSATQLDAVAQTTPGTTSVSLSSYYRVNAFQTDGSTFSTGGFDNLGNAYSATLFGSSVIWNGQTYSLGPANVPDAVTSTTIALPQGSFVSLSLIGAATTQGLIPQPFTITYTDGTTATTNISLSSWVVNQGFPGESIVGVSAYYNTGGGGRVTGGQADLYGYQISLDSSKIVQSITLPNNRSVVIVAMALNTSSTPTVVPGTYVYTPAAGVVPAVGTVPLTVVFTPTNANFGTAKKTVNLVVNKQALLFTANNETAVFGTAVPPYTYTVTGYVNGDSAATAFTGNPSLTTTPAAPTTAGTYTITAATGSLASSNYSLAFATGSLSITKATPVINWSSPANITYGTALGAGQLNATVSGSIPGTFTYSPAASTVLSAGPQTLSVTFTPTDTTDYTTATASVQIIVNQRNLTVTASSYTIPYGTADPAYAATITGFVNGDTQATATTGTPSLTTTPAAPSTPNIYTITAAAGTLASTNYSLTYINGSLTITKGTLTVTAGDATRLYGAANPTFSATATGAVNSDTFTFSETTAATATSPVGTYNIVPTASGSNLGNYNVTYVNGTLTVTKAPLVVTASSYTIPYGTADPAYAATITGFVNSDTQATATTGSPALSTTPAAPSAPGVYPITAAAGTLAAKNYTFTYAPGTLTINKGTLTVTAGNATRLYGAANPTFTATATGAMNSDTFTFSETTTATAASPVGTYNIVPTATGSNLGNYTVTYVNGTLSITQANLTVTANSYIIPYGIPDPAYTATITGFLNGDTQATATTGAPSLSTTPASPSAAGVYPITVAPGTLASTNYSFTYTNGSLTINKASLTVTAASQTVTYGNALAPYTYTITGFLPGDTQANSTSGSPSLTTNPTTPTAVGSYPVTVALGTLASNNYTFNLLNGTVNINKATLTVTAASQTVTFGSPLAPYTYTITGFASGDTQSNSTTGAPSLTTNPATPSATGSYPITTAIGTLASNNYTFNLLNGAVNINKATPTITWPNQSAVYGTALGSPALQATTTIAGTFSYTPSGVLQVGPAVPVIATFTPNDTLDYAGQSATAQITITPAVLTVTANNASRAFAAADPTFTDTISGYVNSDLPTVVTGSATITSTDTPASKAGTTYPISATLGSLAAKNYTFSFVAGTLTITQATASAYTITWPNQSAVYGTALGSPALQATTTIAGTFSYTPSGVLQVGPAVPVIATFTPNDTLDYAGQSATAQITITPAVLTVTADSFSRPYGSANPTFTGTISGAVNSDSFTESFSTTATTTSAAGSYPIIPTAVGTALANYTVVATNGTLTIGKATLTVTAANATRAYGATNPTFSASATGAQNSDTFTFSESTTATATSPTGGYSIVPVATGANITDYNVVYVDGTLTITQATLTVTAADASRPFGATNPVFSASAVGAQNGDTFTFTESTPATTSSPIGNYPIIPVASGTNLSNYTVAYVNGTLTIGKATLTVTAADASRNYGVANPTFSASAAGAQNSDTFTFSESTSATTSSAPGTYAIVPVASGTNIGNYTVVYVNGTLTIGKATLTVTAADASRNYGVANPTFSASATGAQNSDTFTFSESTSATTSSAPGTYAIVPVASGANINDYTVVYVNGTLTISKATLTVTAADASRAYGVANPIFSASATGAQNSDTFTFSESTSATTSSAPGTYAIVPVASGANINDYTVVYVNGTLTIGKATLTVTAADASRNYGVANPTFSASATGAQNSDTFTFSESTSATTSSAPGTYAIVPVASGTNINDYTVVYVNGTLTISKATLTVTAADASRNYGVANPTFSASATGAQNSDTFTFTESTSATISSAPGTYSIVPVASGTNINDYTVVYVDGTLTISKANLTVTAADANRTYGTPNPTFSASATGAQNSDTFTFTESTPATTASAPGTYAIIPVATGTNLSDYNVTYVNGTLTIGKANLTVTAADANRTYGVANPTFSASATGAQNSDTFTFSESTPATIASAPGTYAIIPVAAGTNLSDYNVTYVNGTLTIGKANLTVTAADANRTYGVANPTFSASATGAQNSDTFTFSESTPATIASAPGTYAIIPSATGANINDYNVTYINGTLTIGKATLTVTAADASRAYGAANPTFSASASGAANGDTFTFTESTTAVPTSPVGTYSIVPTATGANLSDYNVVYANGTLTVTQVTLTVTATSATRTYGAANPTFSATEVGAVNGDTFTFSETTTATAASPVGTYPIVPTATGTNLSDYNVIYANGTLTVTQATLNVVAADANRTYGAPNPTFNASATGAQNGDTFTFSATTTATAASPVGTYPIVPTATGTNIADYNVVYTNGTLTVGKANLTITAADANRTYGSPNPAFTASGTGVENNDTFTFTATTTATAASPIGAYPIVPSATGTNLSNYNVVYANGTLTVGQAMLTVTAGSATRIYGSSNPVFSATAIGAVNGDTFTLTESTSATPSSPIGNYPIVPVATGTNLADYNVIYANGVLTVTQATLTVTAANAGREYGIANPGFTAAAAGAVNGDTFTLTESTPATISSQIGTYPIIPAAAGTNLSDYNVVYSNGTLTIGQATLIITANNFTKLYGTPIPVFTGTITGALDGDTFTEIFSNSASTLSQPGQYPIIPAATGTNATDYLQTVQNGMLTITKAPAITTLSLSTTSTVFALPVTFTANVASTTSGTPTGTVTFFDNGNPVNTATLSSSDVATFSTTALSVGVHTITAIYSGDANFNSSTASAASGANTINVAPLDFTIVLTSAQTVEGIYGSTRLYTFHVSPTGGYYPGVINLSASPTGPILATYTFSPSTIAQYAGPADITLTVATRKLASLESPQDRSSRLSHIALGLFLLPLLGLRYSRRSSRKLTRLIIHSLLILSSLGAIGTLTGCGSGYFDRTYPIVVTANSNGIQHTVSVDYHIDKSQQ